MASQWIVSLDGKELGPLTSEELKDLAQAGHVQPTDFVRRSDKTNWVQANQIKGLFPTGTVVPPPVPPPLPTHSVAPQVPKVQTTNWKQIVAGIVAVGFVLNGMVRGCSESRAPKQGPVPSVANPANAAAPISQPSPPIRADDEILTAAFYPVIPGTVQHMTQTNPIKNAGKIQSSNIYMHMMGTIEFRGLKTFTVPGFHDMEPLKPKKYFVREQDGFVDVGTEDEFQKGKRYWHPMIKLGAKAGDEWQREVTPSVMENYKLVKFGWQNWKFMGAVPNDRVFTAYLEKRTTLTGSNGSIEYLEEIELGRGVGLLRRRSSELVNGNKEEKSYEVLVAPLKE
jgi:hypothetical protein